MSTTLPRRPRTWTPKAIPFGLLILLLGLWAAAAPLVGGYFQFGFYSDATWDFTKKIWELHVVPGLVSAIGGFMLMTPARGWGRLGGLLAFLGGAWLVTGWAFYPIWADGAIHPYGGATMQGVRWIGHLLGPGGLILLFTGVTSGLFMRRTFVEQAPPTPVETTQVTVPE
jgi:hypothetical protein